MGDTNNEFLTIKISTCALDWLERYKNLYLNIKYNLRDGLSYKFCSEGRWIEFGIFYRRRIWVLGVVIDYSYNNK